MLSIFTYLNREELFVSISTKRPSFWYLLHNIVFGNNAHHPASSSNLSAVYSPRPPLDDYGAWATYWEKQGHPWRTEPEIDKERQEYLAWRRKIAPDIEQAIYPFKDIHLKRADVEWLLATHENERGPVDWNVVDQRDRAGIDVRGADLRQADLRGLPLACMIGGLAMIDDLTINTGHRKQAAVLLDGATLRRTHLEGAILYDASVRNAALQDSHLQEIRARWVNMEGSRLRGADLRGADLSRSHLEGCTLKNACLDGTDLRGAFFDATSRISTLGSKETTALVSEVHWGEVDLTRMDWSQVIILGDERIAKEQKSSNLRLVGLHRAVRAYRKLVAELQGQGLNEEATRFAYRAQVLQRQVWWFEMMRPALKLRQRMQALGAWLFSWFLFLLAGYGYKLWRSFLSYMLIIIGFATVYYMLGASFAPPLSLVNALALSMTSFHGRGFFPGVTQLNDILTLLASIEAFVGLILEVTFIATLTQRFFGK